MIHSIKYNKFHKHDDININDYLSRKKKVLKKIQFFHKKYSHMHTFLQIWVQFHKI